VHARTEFILIRPCCSRPSDWLQRSKKRSLYVTRSLYSEAMHVYFLHV